MSVVLVTGGSGFIASHTIAQLLAAGHQVRTTVRSLSRETEVRAMMTHAGIEPGARLSFHAADLMHDAGWAEAVTGCDFVHHVASPFPGGTPKDEQELIVPAREGARRVLLASRAAGVKRVVLTSSFAAIGYGHDERREPFTEADWTNPAAPGVTAYAKSKTLAEQAAWALVDERGPELAVVNPVGVFGPILGADLSTSIALVRSMLDGGVPACARLYFGVVDVRDVADLHVRAMTDPAAAGERFLATAGDFLSMHAIATVFRTRLGAAGKRAPSIELPDWLVRLAAPFAPALRPALPELGKVKNASNAKARERLGWTPRPPAEALVATAESLQRFGMLAAAR